MIRILIIEDNLDIRYTLKEICSFAGWEAEEAENGHEGILKFKKNLFFLLLSNLKLLLLKVHKKQNLLELKQKY